MDLPNCPLCGSSPWYRGDVDRPPPLVRCGNVDCSMRSGWFPVADWCKLAAGARYRLALEEIVVSSHDGCKEAFEAATKALEG